MLNKEKNYDFRKRMLKIHEKNIRNYSIKAQDNEFEIEDDLTIFVSDSAGEVILTAAKDFIDYLFTSMNISARLTRSKYDCRANSIVLALSSETNADMEDCAEYRGYRIDTKKDAVIINGFDERGVSQAIYSLEDVMNIRKAPYLPIGTVLRKPMFSPQMVHSGFGLDEYPNEHLSAIAHEGRDAILVFTKDVDLTPRGYLDFNTLIYRAAKYGLDVYAYSYIKSDMHPDDERAEAHYESTYGKLFRMCPGLKGVSLVGESVEFPSKDEHVSGHHYYDNLVDGIPTGKTSPGWYPCIDYADWLNMIKRIIRKYKSDADIIFWTYNWGAKPPEARIKLINALPTDITLMVTFETCGFYDLDGSTSYISDYTISRVGYGDNYFKTEAEAASKRGIRLYSMTNTGGLTWDIGVIPYVPVPYQWMKRYEKMKEAKEKWGLCGIMECHHYGFFPSIISKLSKIAFYNNCENMEEILRNIIAGEFGNENVETVDKALKLWSEAITFCVPSVHDQYGAFRVGPSYPFNLDRVCNLPQKPYAHFGNGIVTPVYRGMNTGRNAPTPILIKKEIKWLTNMERLIGEGLDCLHTVKNPNDKLLRLINLGEFMRCTTITGINAKKWYVLKCALNYEDDREKLAHILNDMEVLLEKEKENVKNAIPLVQKDSRLGWEPSMEYMTDEDHLKWKIRQLDFVLKTEIGCYNKTAMKYDTGSYVASSIDF